MLDHRLNHRHWYGISDLLTGLTIIADNLKPIGKALQSKLLARGQMPLAVNEKIVVRSSCAECAGPGMAGNITGLVLMPDGWGYAGLVLLLTLAMDVRGSVVLGIGICLQQVGEGPHRYRLFRPRGIR